MGTIVASLPQAKQALRSSISVDGRAVSVRLVIVGSPAEAASLEMDVKDRIRTTTGVSRLPRERTTVVRGDRWRVQLQSSACAAVEIAGDAGARESHEDLPDARSPNDARAP